MTNKVTLITAELRKLLLPMRYVVSANTVLPILENGLFEFEADYLKVTVTDLETVVSAKISIAKLAKPFMTTIPFKMFMDFLRNCESENFEFEHDVKNDNIVLRTAEPEVEINIQGESAMNYPKSPVVESLHYNFAIKQEVLMPALKNILPFISHDDLRPAMTGVFFTKFEEHLTIVATDAHKLYRKRLLKTSANLSMDVGKGIIVPQRGLWLSLQLFKNKVDQLVVAGDQVHFRITNDDYTFHTRVIDARFPDWEMVWPKEPPYVFYAKRKQMKSMLTMADTFTDKSTHQVAFLITENWAECVSSDVDFSFGFKYKLPVSNSIMYDNEFHIAFNGQFVLAALGINKDDNTKVQYHSPTKAVIIDDDILIMPLMLNV